MCCRFIVVLCLQMVSINTAPMQLFQPFQQQMLQTSQQQMSMQTIQDELLQQQLFTLQRLQAFGQLNTIHSPIDMPLRQPMLILLPTSMIMKSENTKSNERIKNINDVGAKVNDREFVHAADNLYESEDSDSVVINAEPSTEVEPQTAVIFLPKGRSIIGDIISSIPWLPYEVNVPDTIVWAYDGISSGIAGIISIIGQRLPFRARLPQNLMDTQSFSIKTLIKQLQLKKHHPMTPIIVMPLSVPMLPLQL